MKTYVTLYKKLLTILCLTGSLLLSQTANAEFRHLKSWTKKEKILFSSFVATSWIDYAQTNYALDHPCDCWVEGNPILGSSPSSEKLFIINTAITALLYHGVGTSRPDSANKAMAGITLARFAVIVNNDHLGISWKVAF